MIEFWMCPGKNSFKERIDGSLAAIVDVYSKASPARFSSETTPELFAELRLEDGT